MDVAGKLHGYYETFFPWGGNWFKIQMMHGVFFGGGQNIPSVQAIITQLQECPEFGCFDIVTTKTENFFFTPPTCILCQKSVCF